LRMTALRAGSLSLFLLAERTHTLTHVLNKKDVGPVHMVRLPALMAPRI